MQISGESYVPPEHVYPVYVSQDDEQPSESIKFPSYQFSKLCFFPSPHTLIHKSF